MGKRMETVEAPWPQTVCREHGWPATDHGVCPQHGGDACLIVVPGIIDDLYQRLRDANDRANELLTAARYVLSADLDNVKEKGAEADYAEAIIGLAKAVSRFGGEVARSEAHRIEPNNGG